MNRIADNAAPAQARPCVFKVADREYPFLPLSDPRWEPFGRRFGPGDCGIPLTNPDESEGFWSSIRNRIDFYVEGLALANPDHTRAEWREFVEDLPVSAARTIQIENLSQGLG